MSGPSHDDPPTLQYASRPDVPTGRRPAWVWVVFGIYGLMLLSVAGAAVVFQFAEAESDVTATVVVMSIVVMMLLSGIALVLTPVRIARGRPVTRTSYWLPLFASGFLVGVLAIATGFALQELFKIELPSTSDVVGYIYLGGGAVWFFWCVVLWIVTRGSVNAAGSLFAKLHRWLIGGSVAELLVAVPSHVIVRRRGECCAGMLTGTAICLGAAVMIISMGPAVAFLYFKRWKQIRN